MYIYIYIYYQGPGPRAFGVDPTTDGWTGHFGGLGPALDSLGAERSVLLTVLGALLLAFRSFVVLFG